MDSSTFNNALWKEQKGKLMVVGKRLHSLPSSTDEILSLLEEAESILVGVCQGIPRSKMGPLRPIMTAVITDELFRHADLNIQVAVASCFNELTRINAPKFPYADDLMKDIFKLFMVALKQLSTEPGVNFVRACQILETLAKVKSCLIMLDIEIEAVIVEMFELFFDTIRLHQACDIFNYMETIMTLIIEECEEVSLELLRPLLDSLRKDNKEISPISWELGKTVFEKCGTKLKPCLRQAVKQLNVDDYAEIVSSICKVTSNGQNMVSESVEITEANEEDCTSQLKDANGSDDNNPTENSAETVQTRNNSISPDAVNSTETVISEKGVGAHRAKRCRKPNSLLRPEEGYAHIWTRGRQGLVSHDWNNEAKNQESRKKTRRGLVSQKDESRDVIDEVSESVEITEANEEDFTSQLKDANGSDDNYPTENSAEIVQPRNNSISSDKKVVNSKETVISEKGVGAHRAKRSRKPNSLLRPEEGYAHIWTRGRQRSVSHDWNNEAKNQESRKETSRGLVSQKDESRDAIDKTYNRPNVENGEEMVNARIMVWWPLDKTFYPGTVESFDPLSKKHKIKYDDDEEEVLNLREEKWELFNERPQ